MKKIGTYSIAIIVAAFVFCGGSGVYMPSFCCDVCRSASIEGLTKGTCCESHQADHEGHLDSKAATNAVAGTYARCCFVSHVTYDWMALSTTSILKPELIVYNIITADLSNILVASSSVLNDKTYESSSGPPVLCPRAYLSFLTTLLI